MKSVSTKRLYQYWDQLRGTRPAPERREIEPSAIKSLLGEVFILEHVSETEFNYRLAGSSLCASYCRELKGRSFRDYWNESDLEALDTTLIAIRQDAAAAVIGFDGVNERKQSVRFEMLLLPLRYGGEDYPRILGISAPNDGPYWLGLHPVVEHRISAMRLIWPDEQPSFLRHAVNSPMSMDDDLLVRDTGPANDIFEPEDTRAIHQTHVSDARAAARRQAFRVIIGGRDSD